MNTKLLMSSSAVLMGVAGLCLSFAPHEILDYAGFNAADLNSLVLQILGALYVAFGVMNWMARANLIGGIYSKPAAMGNFAHFFIGGITLVKAAFANQSLIALWIAGIIYSLFAVAFGYVAFGDPLKD